MDEVLLIGNHQSGWFWDSYCPSDLYLKFAWTVCRVFNEDGGWYSYFAENKGCLCCLRICTPVKNGQMGKFVA